AEARAAIDRPRRAHPQPRLHAAAGHAAARPDAVADRAGGAAGNAADGIDRSDAWPVAQAREDRGSTGQAADVEAAAGREPYFVELVESFRQRRLLHPLRRDEDGHLRHPLFNTSLVAFEALAEVGLEEVPGDARAKAPPERDQRLAVDD